MSLFYNVTLLFFQISIETAYLCKCFLTHKINTFYLSAQNYHYFFISCFNF